MRARGSNHAEGWRLRDPSADGMHIYYTKHDGDTALWSAPVAGGEERQVLPSVFNRNFAVLAEGGLLHSGSGPDGRAFVHYLDSSTGADSAGAAG